MSGNIYLVQDSGELQEMLESPYDSEDRLQTLLANYPNLLAGNQINSDSPRRWLLVSREVALPSEEGGYGRWSVDHLFLDQDGIPTIVEVKRSSDTRIRREVIGQMLEYAANAVVYWPLEAIRAQFESSCSARQLDAEAVLDSHLSGEMTPEQFWQAVQTNLQAGRVRLLFVADVIPTELRRLVEFLNGQMSPAEVLAVEVRQYTGPQQRVLVPRVIGQTQQAVIKKGSARSGRRSWNESTFFEALAESNPPEVIEVVRNMLNWARERQLRRNWGTAKDLGSCYFRVVHAGRSAPIYAIQTRGMIQVGFSSLANDSELYADPQMRLNLIHQLDTISGFDIGDDQVDGWPNLPILPLTEEAALQRFFDIFDEVIANIRAT